MVTHKFTIGDRVLFLASGVDFNIPRGTYTIVRKLPVEGRDCQYRVKSTDDGHERVLRESQIVRS
jgi:hypothetical protein